MTAQLYLEKLQAALRIAGELDAEQEHVRAAECLQEALDSSGAWDPATPEEVLLDVAKAAQSCGRERDRQLLRAARLKAYLQL
jgi:hypothetical protein